LDPKGILVFLSDQSYITVPYDFQNLLPPFALDDEAGHRMLKYPRLMFGGWWHSAQDDSIYFEIE
jgi:hypothetical protein